MADPTPEAGFPTPAKVRMALQSGRWVAELVLAQIKNACARIEIAGAIRRGTAEVGEIEIVAIPLLSIGPTPGQAGGSLLDARLEELYRSGYGTPVARAPIGSLIERHLDGHKEKKFTILGSRRESVPLDLFPATFENWGLILAVCTGPPEFSRRLVSTRAVRTDGLLDDGLMVDQGRLWEGRIVEKAAAPELKAGFRRVVMREGTVISTPEEGDFLAHAGGWVPPGKRA